MTFQESIRTCLSKFMTWQGRATRSEYWYFILFCILCQIAASVVDRILGTSFKIANPVSGEMQSLGYGYVYALVGLGLFLPSIAALVRRLHDTGRSGWWYWIALIPLVGIILLLVWLCSRGTTGANAYGADELAGGLSETFR